MKKLVFAIVAVAAVSFASCGGNANNEAVCDSDSCVACDSAACCQEAVEDTTVADSTPVVEEVAADSAVVAE